MQYRPTIRQRFTRFALAAAGVCLLASPLISLFWPAPLSAQVSSYGDKTEGENRGDELPKVLKAVGVSQHLNQQLPLDAEFVDETGKTVHLGDYFGSGVQAKPAVLSLVYFTCPMLCSEELDGLTGSLEMVKLTPGKDFNVVILSIDPTDTPAIAAKKKAFYLKRYGRPDTAAGWHFLTGKKPEIDRVTNATGFGYVKVPGPDGTLSQFAHASSIEVVTASGRLAQYYLGVEYSPKDVLLGLIEASGNKIGSPVANILTYCYHYDPETNKHSLVVARVVQLGGIVTMAGLGGFMFIMFRRDIRLGDGTNVGGGNHGDASSASTDSTGLNSRRGHRNDSDTRDRG